MTYTLVSRLLQQIFKAVVEKNDKEEQELWIICHADINERLKDVKSGL
jgi:hypothetical protein